MKLYLILLTYVAIVAAVSSESPANNKILEHIGNCMGRSGAYPCQDFYEYACGSFASFSKGEYKSIQDLIDQQLNDELISYAKTAANGDYPDFAKKAFEYYESCTSVKGNDSLLPYVQWMEQHENYTWALLTPSTDDDKVTYDWVRTLALTHKYGMNHVLMKEMFDTPKGESSKWIISFDQPTATGKHDAVIERELHDVMLGLERRGEGNEFQNILEPTTEFEKGLIEEKESEYFKEDDDIINAVKDLPYEWLKKYLGIVLDQPSLDADMQVIIKNEGYMRDLDRLLKKHDNQWICRFLEINLLVHLKKYSAHLDETKCMQTTRSLLPMAMHWVYEHHHPELAPEIPKISHMSDNIVGQINETIHDALNFPIPSYSQINNFLVKIGNLPRTNTVRVLDAFYANLKFSSNDDFNTNTMKIFQFIWNVKRKSISQTVDSHSDEFFDFTESEFRFSSALQPHYVPAANMLIIPAELLTMPLYNADLDDVFKYSLMGYIVADNLYNNLRYHHYSEKTWANLLSILSLSPARDVFLSSSPADMLEKSYTIPKMDIELSVQQVYLVSAAQLQCRSGDEKKALTNFGFLKTKKFSEHFKCPGGEIDVIHLS